MKSSRNQEGMALIAVLWIITILTILVASFSTTLRTGVATAEIESRLSRHDAIIDAALELAVFKLLDKKSKSNWLQPDITQQITYQGKPVYISIANPDGLIDLNKTDGKLIVEFLRQFVSDRKQAENIADSILAERTVNYNEPLLNSKGSDLQRKLGRPDLIKTNSRNNFPDIAKFRSLPGVTADLYEQVRPFITVYNLTGKINPAFAPVRILQSVPGLSPPYISDLLKKRAGNPENQKIYSDAISRAKGFLGITDPRNFIIYIASPLNENGPRKGRRYVIATGLDQKRPYRLLSWSEHREQTASGQTGESK